MKNDDESQPLTSEHIVRIGAQTLLVLIVVAGLVVMCCGGAGHPPLGYTTTARVLSIHDGDTLKVEIRKVISIRLDSCWAPELKDPGGPESRDHLRELIDGEDVVVTLKGSERGDVGDVLTFGRAVGTVYPLDSDKSVNQMQIEAGHATAEKQKETK